MLEVEKSAIDKDIAELRDKLDLLARFNESPVEHRDFTKRLRHGGEQDW